MDDKKEEAGKSLQAASVKLNRALRELARQGRLYDLHDVEEIADWYEASELARRVCW